MKKSIKDYDLKHKKVIIRVDFNVPMKDGCITDETRIVASLKTIRYATEQGARVILLSHLGKVKSQEDLVKNDLFPVSVRLGELLGSRVLFSKKTRGEELEQLANSLEDGQVLLIQNTRYEDLNGKKESGCDEELAQYWASFGEIFINDAYGTSHRAHASNVGIAKFLPNGIGFLVKEEISKLDAITKENTHPFIVVMGGAKVQDKIPMIKNLILQCDKVLIGGGMAYTFLKAKGYDIGSSILDEDSLDFCEKMLEKYPEKIVLPIDHMVDVAIENGCPLEKKTEELQSSDVCFDIGSGTSKLFCHELENAKRVIINGPMGCFENSNYSSGTKTLYDFLVEHSIKTLIGGGDSAASVQKLSSPDKFYHISTGGGATLEYLEGKVLPGISVIDEKEKN